MAALVMAPRAEAETGWFANLQTVERQAVVNYLYGRSPQGAMPHSGEAKVIGERIAERAAQVPKTAPEYGRFAAGETTLQARVGLIPRLYAATKYIGASGLAFTVGWKIGEGINSVFLHIGLGDDSAAGSESYGDFCYSEACSGALIWHPHGTGIYNTAEVEHEPGAFLYQGLLTGSSYYSPVRWFDKPCTFSNFTPPPGARMQTGVPTAATCWFGFNESAPISVSYPYVLWTDLLELDTLHPYDLGTDGVPDMFTPAPEDPGATAVEESLEAAIEQDEFMQEWTIWAMEPASQPEEEPAKTGVPPKPKSEDKCTPLPIPTPEDPGENGRGTVYATFPPLQNPFTSEWEDINLYWGTEGFGYRHINLKHGWSEMDQTETEEALVHPSAITPDENPTSTRFYRYYTGNDGKTACTRRVVVQWAWWADKEWPTAQNPAPKHVITSFAYPTTPKDPLPGTGLS